MYKLKILFLKIHFFPVCLMQENLLDFEMICDVIDVDFLCVGYLCTPWYVCIASFEEGKWFFFTH